MFHCYILQEKLFKIVKEVVSTQLPCTQIVTFDLVPFKTKKKCVCRDLHQGPVYKQILDTKVSAGFVS